MTFSSPSSCCGEVLNNPGTHLTRDSMYCNNLNNLCKCRNYTFYSTYSYMYSVHSDETTYIRVENSVNYAKADLRCTVIATIEKWNKVDPRL